MTHPHDLPVAIGTPHLVAVWSGDWGKRDLACPVHRNNVMTKSRTRKQFVVLDSGDGEPATWWVDTLAEINAANAKRAQLGLGPVKVWITPDGDPYSPDAIESSFTLM